MTTARVPSRALALMAVLAACAAPNQVVPEASSTSRMTTSRSTTAESPTSTSRADTVREWEATAGDHFKESAAALEKVSESSAAEDEAGLRAGCRQLHDTNSIGLQDHLPTPDRELTNELQRMIDDMNSATHACLRFALARDPADADTYQEYLGRAVEHLQRARAILNALRR